MKKFSMLLILIISVILPIFGDEIHFLRQPSLTPDGGKVVFSYDSDLWIVSSTGGTAYRITAMEGDESYPRISPDGKWLAFAGTQNGDSNIYVMPLAGGEIRQLTYSDSAEQPSSWSWDSKYIYFTSSGYNDFTTFKISRDGGTPVRIFENYFNTPHDLVEHPLNGDLYFTDTWESMRFANRKGYKGDYNPDIKSFNPGTKEYKIHTNYRGKDFQPVIERAGNIYFISDEANGEYNLYLLRDEKKVQLTSFDSSIFNIQIAADGGKIAFEKDYQVWIYDTLTKLSNKIPIQLAKYDALETEQDFNVSGKITNFDVSSDGKKIVFVSRGELFVSDIEGKFIKQLNTSPEGRVIEVKWLKDNKTILFNQTVNGWLNLFVIAADGKSPEKQLTSDNSNNRLIELNHAMDKAVYLSGRNEMRLLDIASSKSETIHTDEFWGFDNDQPFFSPDDAYIAFSAYRNFESDIMVYNMKDKKVLNITDSGVSENAPYWSPDGKYLYISADRYSPSFPTGTQNSRIYRIPLEKLDEEFRSTEFDKLFIESKETKETADKKNEKAKDKTPAEKPVVVTIDLSDLLKRWELVSPDSGQQFSPYVTKQKDDTYVLYISNHDGDKYSIWKTTYKPFEKPETEKIAGAQVNGLSIASAKDTYYVLVKGTINILNLKENKVKPISMDYTFDRNLRTEFSQMFYETWANLQENYYDENFHGRDWNKIREYYGSFLPYLQSRSDLRILLADMLGELNSSHLGFYSRGQEEDTFYKMLTMQTGIIFDKDKPYVVDRILKESPADKKDINLQSGDVLTSVDGIKVDPKMNRDLYFTKPSVEGEMILGFERNGKPFEIKLHPDRTYAFKELLYDEWIANNQKYVDQNSGGRIAYVYMKDMGGNELNNFFIEMTNEWYKKDALILDLRFNTGGNVHDAVLNFLSRKPYLQWKYRGGKFAPQPNFAPSEKPIVLLVNEQSLSDAEMTSAGFKALKLGKIIGTETYRWLIFTSGKGLVDGSFYRLPCWGCYTLDGKDIERNGVVPDIYVQTSFKDRLEGKDPQLDRAIAEIRKELAGTDK